MAHSPPESVELSQAVNHGWEYSGRFRVTLMSRLPDNLLAENPEVEYSLRFMKADRLPGAAELVVTTKVRLVCQRSLQEFDWPVRVDRTIGFVNHLDQEISLDRDMVPAWCEDDRVNAMKLIEDELMLALPEYPTKPGTELNATDDLPHDAAEEKSHPFAVLKDLIKEP